MAVESHCFWLALAKRAWSRWRLNPFGGIICCLGWCGSEMIMRPDGEATRHSFKSLFWNLDRSDCPSFAHLLAGGQVLSETATALTGELAKEAAKALSSVVEVCKADQVRPLIAELAIIADRRMLSQGEEYFVSYVAADRVLDAESGESIAILDEYIAALQFMKLNGGEPIVPHPDLYRDPADRNSSCGLFILNEDRLARPSVLESLTTAADYSAIRGLRYDFRPITTPRQRVEDRIRYYHDCLLSALDSKPTLARSIGVSLLRQSAFVVVPFIRPYQSAALDRQDALSLEHQQTAAPGGVLFTFLVPTHTHPVPDVTQLGRNLQALLSVAGLVESYSSLAATLQQKETEQRLNKVLDGVAHTALNTLGAIGSEMLCRQLGDDVPPNRLKYKLIDLTSGQRDEGLETELSCAIADAFLAEEAARGFLSLGRILASDAEVLHRFCAKHDYGLRTEIEFAVKMLRARSRRGDIRSIDLASFNGECLIAKGYLQGRVIRSIIYELLLNSAKHGAPCQPDGLVAVDIVIASSSPSSVSVTIRNAIDDMTWGDDPGLALPKTQRRANYLVRLAELCRALTRRGHAGGIGIRTHVEPVDRPTHYIAELTLGTLQVRSHDMTMELRHPVVACSGL